MYKKNINNFFLEIYIYIHNMEKDNISSTSDTSGTSPKGNTNNNLRARIWQFTLNNPTSKEIDYLKEFASKECKYCIWQPERGKNGTPHLQGMFEFKNPRYFNSLKEKFPRMHLEKARKREALIKYCKKSDTKIGDTVEIGEIEELDMDDIYTDGLIFILKKQKEKEDLYNKLSQITEELYDKVEILIRARQYERDLEAKELWGNDFI